MYFYHPIVNPLYDLVLYVFTFPKIAFENPALNVISAEDA